MMIKAFLGKDARYVAASLSGPRIVVADYDKCEMLANIPLPEGVYSSYDMTADAELLVTGYWYTRGVDVWRVRTGEQVFRFPLSRVSRVRFDCTGECIAVTSERGGRVIRWKTGQEHRIERCGDVDNAALRRSDNTMLIPTRRKGRAVHCYCDNFQLTPVQFPTKAEIWAYAWSPDNALLIWLADNGQLACYREPAAEPVWTVHLEEPEHSSQLGFCGDGSLLGVYAVDAGRLMVFDPRTGQRIRNIDKQHVADSRFSGTTAMTPNGMIVDLASAAVEEGCSSWRWWRRAGA